MKEQIGAPDVMSLLVDAFEKSPNQEQERLWLHGDSRLIIVAGRSVFPTGVFQSKLITSLQ
jgi:hypothetical protein